MAENENHLRQRGVVVVRNDYRRRLMDVVGFVEREIAGGGRDRPDFTKWIRQRKLSLKELKELREKLDSVAVNMSYVQGAGNATGMAGSVTAIVGALMALGGSPAGSSVMNVGKLMNNSGNLANSLSKVIRSVFSTQYLQRIGSVLEKDKELSEDIMDWLIFTRDLDRNVEEIFGCSLINANFQNVANTFNEFFKIFMQCNNFESTLSMLRNGRYSPFIGTDVKIEYMHRLCTELETNESTGFSDKVRITLSVFSSGIGAYQVYRDGARFLNGNEVASNLPTLLGGLDPEILTVREAGEFCLFQTIDVALNFLGLLSAYKIIKDGKSQYSDSLREIESLLQLEMQSIEAL
ncbi:uncharacterized protein TNCT_398291 [Trichonephila clavata]|uniref:Uncharacterized protein n=1 Tax=Trichonephila clavata TaxID=2740835 RepID=A0A8X6L1R8_TRICU|nr:uncharacterized protein TNCT_398291 [Trichonephila clavata]